MLTQTDVPITVLLAVRGSIYAVNYGVFVQILPRMMPQMRRRKYDD